MNIEAIPEAQVWAPYRDGFHAAEVADRRGEVLIRIQWRGWDARGFRCCPLCFAPEKGGVHYGSCDIGAALAQCPECEGRPRYGSVANGEYSADVPYECHTCGRADEDYHKAEL